MRHNNKHPTIADIIKEANDIKMYINATVEFLTGDKREKAEQFKEYIFDHLDELIDMIKNKLVE